MCSSCSAPPRTFRPPLVLLVGAGPLAAALVSAAVIVVDTGSLTIAEATGSVRRCWRRGLALGGLVASRRAGDRRRAAVLRLGVGAHLAARDPDPLPHRASSPSTSSCSGRWRSGPRATAAARSRPTRASRSFAARRARSALRVALLLINAIGLAAAVLPFLTMTPAYSALAAARFPEEASTDGQRDLRERLEELRRHGRRQRALARGRRRRVHRARRPIRLRQEHGAPDARRPRADLGGADPDRRPRGEQRPALGA